MEEKEKIYAIIDNWRSPYYNDRIEKLFSTFDKAEAYLKINYSNFFKAKNKTSLRKAIVMIELDTNTILSIWKY